MADPFLGEIRIVSFNFAPQGWAFCNGQFLLINQIQALFTLLGTTFGGNGTTTFALPNLQGRVPIHRGNGHAFGSAGGEAAHTLTVPELPSHTHTLKATSTDGSELIPANNLLARSTNQLYRSTGRGGTLQALEASSISLAGSSQPHQNMQPYLTLSFCISLQGTFPPN